MIVKTQTNMAHGTEGVGRMTFPAELGMCVDMYLRSGHFSATARWYGSSAARRTHNSRAHTDAGMCRYSPSGRSVRIVDVTVAVAANASQLVPLATWEKCQPRLAPRAITCRMLEGRPRSSSKRATGTLPASLTLPCAWPGNRTQMHANAVAPARSRASGRRMTSLVAT